MASISARMSELELSDLSRPVIVTAEQAYTAALTLAEAVAEQEDRTRLAYMLCMVGLAEQREDNTVHSLEAYSDQRAWFTPAPHGGQDLFTPPDRLHRLVPGD